MNYNKLHLLCLHNWITVYRTAIFLIVCATHWTDASLAELVHFRLPRSSVYQRHARNVSMMGSTGLHQQSPELNCINKDISQCTEMLEVLTQKDIGFAASQQLFRMCPVLLKGLTCIDNYTKNCLNEEHRHYFNELYAGTIKVIKDLCDSHSNYHNEYLQHAPCMREVNHKYDQCSDVYHAKTAKLNEINKASSRLTEDDRKMNIITLCCSFQEYLQCSERIVLETCGAATASFTRNFLHRMAGPIVQTKCSRYEPGSLVCLTAADAATSTISTLSYLALLFSLVELRHYTTLLHI